MHYKSDVIISEKVMHNATFAVQDKSLVITHADIPALSLTVGQRVSAEIMYLMIYKVVLVLAVHKNSVTLDLWPDVPKRKRARKGIVAI
jgi:hypothetical protein